MRTIEKSIGRIGRLTLHPYLPWLLIFTVGLFLLLFRIGHESLWYDKSYSAAAVEHRIPEMVSMISQDSHPPLYYIGLRLFTRLFGRSETALRSFSALGIAMLAALGLFPLRKLWGNRRARRYSLLCFITPMALGQAQEARMYAWLAFWTTAMVLFGYVAFRDNRIRDWALFGITAFAAAFTHYYGLVAACCFNLILLIALLKSRREALGSYTVTATALILAYLPWMFKLYSQASRVVKHYWIPPVTIDTVLAALKFPFSIKFMPALFAGPSLILTGGIIIAGLTIALRKHAAASKETGGDALLPAWAILTHIMVLTAAVLLSVLIRPILDPRYSTVGLGLYILALTYTLDIIPSKRLRAGLLTLYILFSSLTILTVYTTRFNGPMREVVEALKDEVKPGDVSVHGTSIPLGTFSYYFPDNPQYLYIPDGFIPFSNYEILRPGGEYGPDYRQFLSSRNTVPGNEPSRLRLHAADQ